MSSPAQLKLIAQLEAGARLAWAAEKGKYQLVDGPRVRTVDPRTVDQLVAAGRLWRDLVGGCVLAPADRAVDSTVSL